MHAERGQVRRQGRVEPNEAVTYAHIAAVAVYIFDAHWRLKIVSVDTGRVPSRSVQPNAAVNHEQDSSAVSASVRSGRIHLGWVDRLTTSCDHVAMREYLIMHPQSTDEANLTEPHALGSEATAAKADGRLNVVLVVCDDLGWADTGPYGATAIPTPTLDRLAADGLRFTDAHAASAVCTPSRYALQTGRYPWRSPLKQGVLGGFDPPLIEPDRLTIADAFHHAGYATGYFGKWHLGLTWTRTDGSTRDAFTEPGLHGDLADPGRDIDYAVGFDQGPTERGYDTFFGVSGSLDMAPYCFLSDGHTVGLPDRDKDVDDDFGQRPGRTVEGWRDDQADSTMVDRATTWIGDQIAQGLPFFTTIATMAPHRPCVPPAQYHRRSSAGRRGDAVVMVDDLFGRIREAVAPVADRTVVIFTSDNGAPVNYPEDGDTFRHRPNGPWRGQKADIWEAGHRIPLIITGPGVRSGATCDRTVSLMDLFPTLLEHAAGCRPEPASGQQLDGRSFARWLADPAASADQRRIFGLQSLNGMLALRYGTRKAVLGTGSGGFTEMTGQPSFDRDAVGQLFDLSDDPGEQCNRWRQSPGEAWRVFDDFVTVSGYDEQADAPRSASNDMEPIGVAADPGSGRESSATSPSLTP